MVIPIRAPEDRIVVSNVRADIRQSLTVSIKLGMFHKTLEARSSTSSPLPSSIRAICQYVYD